MKKWLLLFILLSVLVFAVPTVLFYSQVPADLSSFNIFGTSLAITYNITDPIGIDPNTPKLYYVFNATNNNCLGTANGSVYSCGYQVMTANSNSSSLWLFQLADNQVYPATYNWPNERQLELYTKSFATLSSPSNHLLIEFLNVSSVKEYGMFEVYANRTAGTSGLSIYYCNSSYNKNTNPPASPDCINFATIPPTAPFNHSHSAYSYHHVVPFSMNISSGLLGTVRVTSRSYFIFRPTTSSGIWRIYYITNQTRVNATMTRTFPGAYSNLAGTVDSHLHQYNGSEELCYYACANNTANVNNCSVGRCDLIDLGGLPPVPPFVYNPTAGPYSGNITINYTAAVSPNNYNISYYSITLVDVSYNFVQNIIVNNSLSLNYIWNSASASDGSYFISVEACDVLGQCSFGYSEQIDLNNGVHNLVPEFSFSTLIFAVLACLFFMVVFRRNH